MQTLYSRLSDFKAHAQALALKEGERRLSPLALDLGLATPVPVIDIGENPAEHFYEHALDLAEKLFDNEIDQSSYEESLRYMVGIKAYPLFTVDKLISTLIKHVRILPAPNYSSISISRSVRCIAHVLLHLDSHVLQIHTINSDGRCQDLVSLLEADRAREFTTAKQQVAYRAEAEEHFSSDENFYRIEWVRCSFSHS